MMTTKIFFEIPPEQEHFLKQAVDVLQRAFIAIGDARRNPTSKIEVMITIVRPEMATSRMTNALVALEHAPGAPSRPMMSAAPMTPAQHLARFRRSQ